MSCFQRETLPDDVFVNILMYYIPTHTCENRHENIWISVVNRDYINQIGDEFSPISKRRTRARASNVFSALYLPFSRSATRESRIRAKDWHQ